MEKVLIIDDSKLIRRNIRSELEKLDYIVYEAASSKEAEEHLLNEYFDVITTDMILPDASGLEVCQKIKSNLKFENTAVIIITSKADTATRAQCFKSGATGYFTKSTINKTLSIFLKSLKHFVNKCRFDGLKALIVEDSALQRQFISGLLKKISIHTVGVETIDSAIQTIEKKSFVPDLILVDYFFSSGQTCEDLISYIRRDQRFNKVPVIAMTVADDREIRTRLFHLGVNDFFHKPFDVEEFYLRMRVHLQNKMLLDDMEKKNQLLQTQAITDSLTGIYNRRYFYEALNAENARFQRTKDVYSLIIFDIDHFKRINDQYGHTSGDEVIKEIASILKNSTRDADTAARYGGEEFIVLLPSTSCAGATILAEKLRETIHSHIFAGLDIVVTCSFGVASVTEAALSEKVVSLADKYLYQAKDMGRNCVVSRCDEKIDNHCNSQ